MHVCDGCILVPLMRRLGRWNRAFVFLIIQAATIDRKFMVGCRTLPLPIFCKPFFEIGVSFWRYLS